MQFDAQSVYRRRIARRWSLLVLLTHNPSLMRYRKHNLMKVLPGQLLHGDGSAPDIADTSAFVEQHDTGKQQPYDAGDDLEMQAKQAPLLDQ